MRNLAPYLYAGIVWGILGTFLTLLFLRMFTFAIRREQEKQCRCGHMRKRHIGDVYCSGPYCGCSSYREAIVLLPPER